MIVIWRGYGWLVPVIVIAALVGTQLSLDSLLGADTYTANEWAKFLAVGVAAVGIAFTGYMFNFRKRAVIVNEETGEQQKSNSHTFFWIPIEFWAVIVPVLFTVIAYQDAAEKEQFQALIAAPQVNDIYLVDFSEIYEDSDPTYHYGALKVVDVVDGEIVMVPGEMGYNLRQGPQDAFASGEMDKPAYFLEHRLYTDTGELLELLEKDGIYSILR